MEQPVLPKRRKYMTEDLSLLYPEDGRREADIGATLRMSYPFRT